MKNGLYVDLDGTKRWFKDNLYHREDGPAVEYPNGDKLWYMEGFFCHSNINSHITGNTSWYYKNKLLNVSSQEEFIRLINLKLFW